MGKPAEPQEPSISEAELEKHYRRLAWAVTDPPEPGEWLMAMLRDERDRLDEQGGPLSDRVAALGDFRRDACERCRMIFGRS